MANFEVLGNSSPEELRAEVWTIGLIGIRSKGAQKVYRPQALIYGLWTMAYEAWPTGGLNGQIPLIKGGKEGLEWLEEEIGFREAEKSPQAQIELDFLEEVVLKLAHKALASGYSLWADNDD
ncbi:hypothetical protein O181_103734 [Austropuccinia psidii MF-1]|uniref:Uncharacterized protein n=1 Tax=Austropuccinia psidii MF-1 TaxID=1389203 RepID=A0A9Q3PJI0_9BASI|nr:hypothetical protein [Austropuccinia psidii MF-1]